MSASAAGRACDRVDESRNDLAVLRRLTAATDQDRRSLVYAVFRGGSGQFARCPIQARVSQEPVNTTLFAPSVRVSTQLAVAYRRRDQRVFGSASAMLRRDKGIWTSDPSKPFGLMVTASQPQVTNCFPAQAGGSQSAPPSTKTGG